jgi:hypothetical protein
MKRHFIIIFLTFITLQVHAQEQKHVVGIHAGVSWIGVFTNMANHYNIVADVNTAVTPAFTLSYDYKVMDRITVGGAVTRQRFSLRYRNYAYEDENGNEQTGNFSTDLTRMNFAVRGLYHYLRSEKRELYAGIRIGINNWSLDTTVKDPRYDVSRYLRRILNYGLGATPSVQLILFGFKGYFTPNFGANIETAIGAPHFISFGLIYRW